MVAMSQETMPEQSECSITAMECAAMRLLKHEWSQAEMSTAFETSVTTVDRHANGRCTVHAKPEHGGRRHD